MIAMMVDMILLIWGIWKIVVDILTFILLIVLIQLNNNQKMAYFSSRSLREDENISNHFSLEVPTIWTIFV